MSRRRNRHLEQSDAVAEQVQVALQSRGPCPGSCNRAYRRTRAEWEREVHDEFDRLVNDPDEPVFDVDAAMYRATQLVRAEWERKGRAAWPAREGAPVWCGRCSADIRDALARLPQVLLLVLETGVSTPTRPDGSRVTDPVAVLSTSTPDEQGTVVDELGCGHRRTRARAVRFGPEPAWALSGVVCRTCVVTASTPEPGKLAPAERAARAGQRLQVSPAGSPAWLEADAAIQWLCSTAEQAAYGMRWATTTDAGAPRWPWRAGSTESRVRAAVDAAGFMRRHLDTVLALPGSLPESIGRQAVGLDVRLTRLSGMAVDEQPVDDDCPLCGRRGMRRRGALISCRSCGASYDQHTFDTESE
ncbi:hypothetical protein [Serinicoccus sediminis]|uniref:hypothetical protein n=1 Tax=Serinicoccus sediminis TaxID=2306021 RepID=UPI0010221052|nr:hypothetical protein [Serinicoccus sediminis]